MSAALSAATPARIFFASAVPSIRLAPPLGDASPLAEAPSGARVDRSAGKVHRPRLADQHDLDLSRILELGLDATRDLLGERRHAAVVHVVRDDHHADLSARLDGEHALHALVARRDALEPL